MVGFWGRDGAGSSPVTSFKHLCSSVGRALLGVEFGSIPIVKLLVVALPRKPVIKDGWFPPLTYK